MGRLLEYFSTTERRKRAVWTKAFVIPGYDPRHYRMDANRRIIRYGDFANPASPYAWEFAREPIAHAREAADNPGNLQPLNLRDLALMTCGADTAPSPCPSRI